MEKHETVVLEIEETPVECVKKVLIENSDYFSAMFKGSFKESSQKKIKIEGVDLKSFNTILLLLWDQTHVIDINEIDKVLQAACMLQFATIKKICEDRILENLNPSICLKIWKTTEMLDISPLWLEAKSMALEEFDQICDSTPVLELSLDEICTYLGHINLKVTNELIVFQAAMNWWYENQEVYENTDCTRIILRILNCIDFKKLKDDEIKEMQTYPDIVDNLEIICVLNCIRLLMGYEIDVESEFCTEQVKYATHLCNSKSRRVPRIPCVLLQADIDDDCPNKKVRITGRKDKNVVVYDVARNTFRNFFVIDADKIKDLVGFKFLAYKEFAFLYGGEFIIGNGNWNLNLWSYDTIKEKWERKSVLPDGRRHFETALVGNRIYIVGGTGKFRVLQENLLWYDIKSDEWSSIIPLPYNNSSQYKCCAFSGKLCLIYLSEKRAVMFSARFETWRILEIAIEMEEVKETGVYAVFSDNQYIYVKGKRFIKFKLDGDTLAPISQRVMRDIDYEEIETILCNNVVYTLYKCVDIHYSFFYTFESLDLDTDDLQYIFRNKFQDQDSIEVGDKLFRPAQYTKMFSIHYYYLVKENNFVNDFLPE